MKLTKGMNLGGYLSQCNYETKHFDHFIKREDIKKIKAMGFDHIRLPIDCNIFENENQTDNEEGLQYVTQCVKWCEAEKLAIILDLHKAYGYDFNDAGDESKNTLFTNEKLKKRFIELWEKITKRYGHYSHVAFELLNEVVEKENAESWNALIEETVKVIRKNSPTAIIIYGGIQWNSVKTLQYLKKPEDENILFTFHFYEPLIFTHQKAHWVQAMDPSEEISYPEKMAYYVEKSKKLGFQGEVVTKARTKTMGPEFIEEMVKEAVLAAQKANVHLYCGEFGVIDQAPIEDTYRWFADVEEIFQKYQIGFALWTYKEMDFGFTGKHYEKIRKKLLDMWSKQQK